MRKYQKNEKKNIIKNKKNIPNFGPPNTFCSLAPKSEANKFKKNKKK